MEIYELEAFLGEIKDDEKVGIMEKHHIVFRSQGGCDFYYNIIELPTGLHKGRRGPHMCRETDVFLKRGVRKHYLMNLAQKERPRKKSCTCAVQ